ncbi:K(+)-transporting ATPase subunit C [Rhodocytophaga aerolata]|uniref:Potassium-transporting ATPase KdpC subunit n=1 Tax=Rhodocytophaga aerolata TaxID=455078 RepID=A0ABT8RJL6_9BACT|nr:K(+)-transporting ATPase subunit C [Rhodocytophaga aerolata]MDO1451468.1 K(+)-transporting ATPase subunit C [Rhodocytophaga aerolata]
MKLLKQSLVLTLCCIAVFGFVYPLLIWGVAQVAGPNNGKGEVVEYNGRVVGFKLIGQSFTEDKYFNSRPSAVGYNAASTGGSNKGPTNPDYLSEVQARIDTFLAHNPGVAKSQIPVDIVTASGGGLDPHISPQAAYLQVKRIAKVRNLAENEVKALVDEHIDGPLLGLMGTSKVNVLKLNIALEKLAKK